MQFNPAPPEVGPQGVPGSSALFRSGAASVRVSMDLTISAQMDPQRSAVTAAAVSEASLDRQPDPPTAVLVADRGAGDPSVLAAPTARYRTRRMAVIMLLAALVAISAYVAIGRIMERPDLRTVPNLPPDIARWLPKAIKIGGMGDAIARRRAIWSLALGGADNLDAVMPDSVVDAPDQLFPAETTAEHKELRVELPLGFVGIVDLIKPRRWNGDVFIMHHGHKVDEWRERGRDIVERLLAEGYLVVAISMPGTGKNVTPEIVETNEGPVDLRRKTQSSTREHRLYVKLRSKTFSPLVLFLRPILAATNYVAATYKPAHIMMTGLSGGAWATTVYAALDERIEGSFPVAGTWPLYAYDIGKESYLDDYEPAEPYLLSIANYLELYVLGSIGPGRRQIQISNQFDPCCFFGLIGRTYQPYVKQALAKLGYPGNWDLVILDHDKHEISPEAIDIMLAAARELSRK